MEQSNPDKPNLPLYAPYAAATGLQTLLHLFYTTTDTTPEHLRTAIAFEALQFISLLSGTTQIDMFAAAGKTFTRRNLISMGVPAALAAATGLAANLHQLLYLCLVPASTALIKEGENIISRF